MNEKKSNYIVKLGNDVRNGDAMSQEMKSPGMKLFLAQADFELGKLYRDLNSVNHNKPDFDPDKDMKIKHSVVSTIAGANLIRTIPETIIARGLKAHRKLNQMKEEAE